MKQEEEQRSRTNEEAWTNYEIRGGAMKHKKE
jgi:hypothetical protein